VIAAVPALIAVMLWAILDLERFMMFAVLGAMVFPASLVQPFGTNVAAVDLLLVLAVTAWLITNSVRRAPDPWVKRNPLIIPALLFVAVNAVSLVWSIKPRTTLVFTIQLIELIIVFPLVFASLPRSVATIRKAFVLFIALTCVMAVATFVVYVTHPNTHTQGTYLPGLNKNAIGTFLAAGLILAYAQWITSERSRARALLAVAFVVDVAGLIGSGSRGAIIGAGVAILGVGFLLGRRRLLAVMMVGTLAVLYVAVIQPEQVVKANAAGAYDSSVIRQYAWEGAIKKIEQRPVLGTGGGTYVDTLPHLTDYIVTDPNNLFLLTWGELGIPGMAALIYLLFNFGRLLVRVRRLPSEAAVLAVAAGGVALSLFAHFQVDVSWSRGETTLAFAMMGLMVALTRLCWGSEDSPPELEHLGFASETQSEPPIPAGVA
jgi:O-antigen ligase